MKLVVILWAQIGYFECRAIEFLRGSVAQLKFLPATTEFVPEPGNQSKRFIIR